MKWLIGALLFLVGCGGVEHDFSGKKDFQAALEAKTIIARKEGLNRALEQLLEANETAAVFRNLSNTFYLLGEAPWGIYYDYKALQLEPRNEQIQKQIDRMAEELKLPVKSKENPFAPLIGWHQLLSVGEKFQLFLVGLLGLFVTLSLKIWRDWRWLWPLIAIFAVLSAFLGGSLLYTRYGAPIEGILVKPAALYREPNRDALLVNEEPLKAGLKLEILDEREAGEWLKIKTDRGEYGYINYKAVRLL